MKFAKEGLISLVILMAASFLVGFVSNSEETSLRKNFAQFPLHIGEWTGKELGFDAKLLNALRVDDYMMRQYRNVGGAPIGLYIGYYKSMRQGATYHSPKNCLPGSGWYFTRTDTTSLHVGQEYGLIKVNSLIIQKGLDKQLVLYWYQDRGRIITSEYWAKIYMVWDSMFKNRTDGAFVRLTVPFVGDDSEAVLKQGKAFAEQIFPLLWEYLPS